MLTTTSHPSFQTPIDNQIDGKTVNTDELIIDLLAADRPLLQIAQAHKLTLSQLTVWFAQPAVRALLDALDELANRRAESTAIHARHAAIVVLKEQAVSLCETPRALELAGKAARTLFRHRPTPTTAPPPMNNNNPPEHQQPSSQEPTPPQPTTQEPQPKRAAKRRAQPNPRTHATPNTAPNVTVPSNAAWSSPAQPRSGGSP